MLKIFFTATFRKTITKILLISAVFVSIVLLSLFFNKVSAQHGKAKDSDMWPDFLKKEMVELKVDKDTLLLTISVPKYKAGKEVKDYKTAFFRKIIKADDGRITLPVTSVPVYLEEPGVEAYKTSHYQESPFGIHDAAEKDAYLEDLGIHWRRAAGLLGIVWGRIEPEKGHFDWSFISRIDDFISRNHKKGIQMMITILTPNPWDQLPPEKAKDFLKKQHGEQEKELTFRLPKDLDAYANFLQKIVERYDGDGVDDAPGSPTVRYWQIDNESDIFWKDNPENFARLVKLSYKAIKKASPEAQLVLSGVGMPRGFLAFYVPMLRKLDEIKDKPEEKYFDIFDLHWWVGGEGGYLTAPDRHFMGEISDFREYIKAVRTELEKYNYHVPVWITEMCTYTGKIRQKNLSFLPYQNEIQQAGELLKRFVYPLSLGVEKIFWSTIVDNHNWGGDKYSYFNQVGLIYNPKNNGESSKKLSYYTYKLIVEKMEGCDWKSAETLNLGKNIFAYRFMKNGKSIYIIWRDEQKS